MFIIRRAKIEDVSTFLKLAKMVHFINLPPDKDIITDKVLHSRNCFIRAGGGAEELAEAAWKAGVPPVPEAPGGRGGLAQALSRSDLFVFALEDTESGSVLGTSQLVARMGGPGAPNVSFKLSKREFFSTSLQVGTAHMVAKLYLDETGPTEIGGLILQPSFRSHKLRLGRFLSLIRFHFVGLYRHLFADRMLAEMMAPITSDGRNTLWEYLGRRFINLSYTEADRFCQYSKEFMISLLPKEEIYLSLLPPEARNVVGQVGPETVPARRMLENLGFQYRDLIDPFDGGPHLEAVTDDLSLVRETRTAPIAGAAKAERCTSLGFLSVLPPDGDFRAIQTELAEAPDGSIKAPKESLELLGARAGDTVGMTVLRRKEQVPRAAPIRRRAPAKSGKGR